MKDSEIITKLNLQLKDKYFRKVQYLYSENKEKYYIGIPFNSNNNSLIFYVLDKDIKLISPTKDDEIRMKYKDVLCNLK